MLLHVPLFFLLRVQAAYCSDLTSNPDSDIHPGSDQGCTLMLSILRSNELGLLKIIEKSQKILC